MPDWLVALAQVLFIDVVLAGDNAIVVGMAAAGLPSEQRRRAIFWGIAAATVMRIGFAAIAVQLLAIVGIALAGGILLLWVCWKMLRELREGGHEEEHGAKTLVPPATEAAPGAPRKTLRQATVQILVADVSMSLDNVLAVAGASHGHLWVLVVGLVVSVALMGLAATLIAQLLARHGWIAWVGLLVIVYVALQMIFQGTQQVTEKVPEAYAYLLLPFGYLALPGVFPVWLWVGVTALQLLTFVVVATVIVDFVTRALQQRG
jgi:YjbE family integral membrane protein